MITKKRLTIVFSLIVGLLMCLPMTTYADSSDSSNTSGNLPSNLGNYDKGGTPNCFVELNRFIW